MAADHIRILLGLILAGIIACAAFILNRISLDALKAAILAGTFAFGLGGFQVATALVLFFVTSVLLSDLPGKVADPHGERPEDHNKRRTGRSEERRVGKEGRPGGAADTRRKKEEHEAELDKARNTRLTSQ